MVNSRVPETRPGRPISGKLASCSMALSITFNCFSAADKLSSEMKLNAASSCAEALLVQSIRN